MSTWRQRWRELLGSKTPVLPPADNDREELLDEDSIRTSGKPVLCVIGEWGLARIDRSAFMIEPIGDGLCKIIGLALAGHTLFADKAALASRGFQGPDVWEIARANTAGIMPIIPTAAELIEERDFCFESELLVPSMMAELDAWERISGKVGGDLYVAPVSDCFTLVGLAGDGGELDDVASGAAADFATISGRSDPLERAVSPYVYRFREGGWRRTIADSPDGSAAPSPGQASAGFQPTMLRPPNSLERPRSSAPLPGEGLRITSA